MATSPASHKKDNHQAPGWAADHRLQHSCPTSPIPMLWGAASKRVCITPASFFPLSEALRWLCAWGPLCPAPGGASTRHTIILSPSDLVQPAHPRREPRHARMHLPGLQTARAPWVPAHPPAAKPLVFLGSPFMGFPHLLAPPSGAPQVPGIH